MSMAGHRSPSSTTLPPAPPGAILPQDQGVSRKTAAPTPPLAALTLLLLVSMVLASSPASRAAALPTRSDQSGSTKTSSLQSALVRVQTSTRNHQRLQSLPWVLPARASMAHSAATGLDTPSSADAADHHVRVEWTSLPPPTTDHSLAQWPARLPAHWARGA